MVSIVICIKFVGIFGICMLLQQRARKNVIVVQVVVDDPGRVKNITFSIYVVFIVSYSCFAMKGRDNSTDDEEFHKSRNYYHDLDVSEFVSLINKTPKLNFSTFQYNVSKQRGDILRMSTNNN